MTEAAPQPTKSRSSSSTAVPDGKSEKSFEGRSLKGVDSSMLELGGFGLITYGLYSVVRTFLDIQAWGTPEASLSLMLQLVSLFPLLVIGPILIFAPQGSIRVKSSPKKLTKWLTFILAAMFLFFIPLSFFNHFTLIQTDTNQVKRLESSLEKRKQEILRSVKDANTPPEFQKILSTFSEIRDISFSPGQSGDSIRKDISDGIDRGIESGVERLRASQRERSRVFANVVRNVALGSFISGFTFFVLATWLLDWLLPARKVLTNLAGILTKGFPLGYFFSKSKSSRRTNRNFADRKTAFTRALARFSFRLSRRGRRR
jgi:hypothetical protein